MTMKKQFTAIIDKEDDMYVALCPELDIASQGDSIVEAKTNLSEAVSLFLNYASQDEIDRKVHVETYITQFEIALG